MSGESRAQSEVIGVVLLTAVVVILVTVVGAVVLSQWESEAEREPRVDVRSNLSADELKLRHMGGDRLAASDVEVLLRGDEINQSHLSGFDEQPETDGWFEEGTTWKHDFSTSSGVIDVLVVHRPSGTVIHEKTHEV